MSTGSTGRLGPSIILRNGQLIEEESREPQQQGMGSGSNLRRVTVTRSRLYLGCTTMSADAVEFVI